MISISEAEMIVMNNCRNTGICDVPLTGACGRVLAEDVISDVDMPPFNRAAVDGYACRRAEISNELYIIETIRAGAAPLRTPGVNECSKIMTGAIVPDGYDMIFAVEDSAELGQNKVRFNGKVIKENISYKAEDVREGDVILKKFRILKPQDIAVLASSGYHRVKVSVRPRVGIISTGDELVEPDTKPGISQIRNSNSYQLLAQCERAGADARYLGIVPDDEEKTFAVIEKAVSEFDIIILTGGVSMGDFDYVPAMLERAGVKILFDAVNVQPGKPTTFGVHPKSVIFGLPGNPVSAFIQFENLVRPFICKMMNSDWKPAEITVPMAGRYERRSASRFGWIPVRVNKNGEAEAIDYHGSAHITAFPHTDGIIGIEPGKNIIEKGEKVNVRQV